ncbi:interleukin-6 receptor subunit beta isoform X2 [Kryptolebias marmoratus]|uniref:Interleukin-6 receptor subunit beta-like n=1 Tax=Kryptolebias marmoratus TaxID=37003 RepID=A0A3Q3B9Q5_KRYMA|nr:interleukin-6 receptor subunit beta isoform X2 [Kryptolebias marmoratus]
MFFKRRLAVRSGSVEASMFALRALFTVAAVTSVCKGQQDIICNVEPKDVHIEVGSSVEITCHCSRASGQILWTLNQNAVDESLSTSINSTHTVLSLRNFTKPSATLQCHSSHTNQILGGTTIKTYTRPRDVSCVLHYEHKKSKGIPNLFTCRWDHQANPLLKINYTVLMSKTLEKSSQTEICNSQKTSCTYKNIHTSGILIFFDKYTVTVRAKTAAWEASSDPFEFDPLQIIKINPPTVKVNSSSNRLLVTVEKWCPFTEDCRCQVKYYKASEPNETPKLISTTDLKVDIKEVGSCINYNVSVRCAEEMAVWSNWSPEQTIRTKLNKAHIRLCLWRKVAAEGENGKRKVHLMWKGIPSMCEERFYYTVKQTYYTKDKVIGNCTSTSCGNSPCDVEVDQDAHRLCLTVSSDEGLLAEESVYVPAVEESLPQVTDIQTFTQKGITKISWKAPVQPVRDYIIDWTHNGNRYDWKNSTFTNATLFDLLNRTQYNITVTPLMDDRTGQSTQAPQICSSMEVPEVVAIRDVQTYDTSASVNWDTQSQYTCSDVVTFTVFYELQEGPLLNITIDGKKHDIVLKDLKPEMQYSVTVEAKGHDGTTTSRKRFFTTKKFDPRFIKALSVCGSIILLFVLFFGLCCAIQWKKFLEKPVPNPGLSSLAKWLSQNHHKGVGIFQSFTHHSENICDQVYTEESRRPNMPSITPICYETQLLSSPEESISSLSTESSSMNPYRSQSSMETSMPRTEKLCQGDSGKPHEKTTPKSVYVSLSMLEQGNVR